MYKTLRKETFKQLEIMTYYNHPADEPNSPVWDNEPAFNWREFVEDHTELKGEWIFDEWYSIEFDNELLEETSINFHEFKIEIYLEGEYVYDIEVWDYQRLDNVWNKEHLEALISYARVKASEGNKEQPI